MVPDDETLRAMLAAAAGGRVSITPMWRDGPPVLMSGSAADLAAAELMAAAPALAAEVLWLRERVARAETVRDDAADAFDILVRRVWEAATGDTHEGPASVDVLLEAVAGLRARAEKAEAERDAVLAAADEYARSHARGGSK